MHILWTIIIGFVVGVVARLLMPGRDPAGFIITTILGIIGAFLGSFLGQALGLYREGEPAGFIVSVLAAVLILFIYKKVASPRPVV